MDLSSIRTLSDDKTIYLSPSFVWPRKQLLDVARSGSKFHSPEGQDHYVNLFNKREFVEKWA